MTTATVIERKGDLSMAGATASSFDVRKHREVDISFLGAREYFGVAQFTAVPDGMLLMRKLNRLDPWISWLDAEVFSVLHLGFLD